MKEQRRKHVPLRTCIGCFQKRPKRELVRIVRTPEQKLEVDPRGKQAGRGAYLCPEPGCIEKALDTGRLGRALKSRVTAQAVVELQSAIDAFLEATAPPEQAAEGPRIRRIVAERR